MIPVPSGGNYARDGDITRGFRGKKFNAIDKNLAKMIWGAFCGTTKSDLTCTYLYSRQSEDQLYSLHTNRPGACTGPLLASMLRESTDGAIVQEGNAPGHKGHSNRYREPNGIEVPQWPAQSPDFESHWIGVEGDGDIVGRDLGGGGGGFGCRGIEIVYRG